MDNWKYLGSKHGWSMSCEPQIPLHNFLKYSALKIN